MVDIVDRLEEKGLVYRQRDTKDRRNVFVALRALSEAERQTLVVTLEQFATLLEAKIPVPVQEPETDTVGIPAPHL